METQLSIGHSAKGAAVAHARLVPRPLVRGTGTTLLVLVEASSLVQAQNAARLIDESYAAAASDYPLEALRQALAVANGALWQEARDTGKSLEPLYVVCAVIRGAELVLGLVGGGQARLLRAGDLRPLLAEPTAGSPGFQPLGAGLWLEPLVVASSELRASDRLVLATGKLLSVIDAAELARLVEGLGPQEACDELVAQAGARGQQSMAALIVRVDPGAGHGPSLPSRTVPLAQTRVSLPDDDPGHDLAETQATGGTWAERPQVLRMRERALEERANSLARGEAALAARERAVAEREQALQAAQATLLAWERSLAERQRSLATTAPAEGEYPASISDAAVLARLDGLHRAQEALAGELHQLAERTAALGQEQALVRAEIEAQRQELVRWVHRLGQYERGLQTGPNAPPVGLQLLEREVAFLAEDGTIGFEAGDSIVLPNGSELRCGLCASPETYRRRFPMAVEVWIQSGEERQTRLLVGYGLDVRTMPPGTVQKRAIAVIASGHEALCFSAGSNLVFASVRACEFASVAQDKVAHDYTAFRSLVVRFQVLAGT
ncbi:MAG: hypothetical protein ACUVX9_17305 [Anaerolineae bacterium]